MWRKENLPEGKEGSSNNQTYMVDWSNSLAKAHDSLPRVCQKVPEGFSGYKKRSFWSSETKIELFVMNAKMSGGKQPLFITWAMPVIQWSSMVAASCCCERGFSSWNWKTSQSRGMQQWTESSLMITCSRAPWTFFNRTQPRWQSSRFMIVTMSLVVVSDLIIVLW